MADPIVKVKQGQLLGKKDKTLCGKDYYCFSGIPYAQPPVGKLRFKDPQLPLAWDGIRDATKESEPAAQCEFLGTDILGSDDCLYLNVCTPKLKSKELLPVMVNFHGGGFAYGSGGIKELGPDFLISKDVVFVSLNYRLGVMGYLCTDPVNARGDMGLWDQNMALRWVKDNIKSFNGDPNNITIFGISAGGASVEYHLLSKLSSNLFNKAIIHSGSSLNPWARTVNGVNMAMKLAKALGYQSETTDGLFDFINTFETKEILKVARNLFDINDAKMGNLFAFTPVLNEFRDGRGFIDEEPAKLLKRGYFNRVPTISGVCNVEGMIATMLYKEDAMKEIKAGKYINYVPKYLKNANNLDEKIDGVYKKLARSPEEGMTDFLSDLSFTAGVIYSAEQRIKHNPNEYFYQFCYDGGQNMVKTMTNSKEPGASHGDDTSYIGPTQYVDHTKATKEDLVVRERMTTMWTDFAKTGNPTPTTSQWLPLDKNNFNYLNIDKEIVLKKHLNVERRRLWQEIYDNMSQLRE